ncbi:MAG: hypothetical protein LC753_10795 [Acidobacteria bacterium]|nr:hypothetical protein [Acidobacteriota bacterium]MCA1650732.1 hypothetical protein [Acidobacteriota bacterium]
MSRLTVFVVAVLMTAAPVPSVAQDRDSVRTAATQELVLRDGSRLYGTIEQESETEISFRTVSGALITALRSDVISVKHRKGEVRRGEFQPRDPNSTRLFFGPTGRSLERGQTYLGVYEFMMPFVQVGVTDRFSIGGGTPLVFGIDDWERPFWVTPKLQLFHGASTDISVGALHAFDIDGDGGGIAYAVGTNGSPDGSVTAGAGMGYATGGGRAAVVMIGGERRVRRNMKLITENYVWNGGKGFASVGIRFFGERLSADLALASPIGADEFFAFPMINFVYVF